MALDELFRTGRAVDIVLAVIAVEFVLLTWRGRSPGGAPATLGRALALAPGVLLLLALRASLTGSPWTLVAAFLAAAFPFHLADLIRRERRVRRPSG